MPISKFSRSSIIISTVITLISATRLSARDITDSGDTLRIGDVVRAVVRNNDQAAAARYMEQAAYDKIGPAGAWDDPMLMVGVTGLPTSGSFNQEPMTMKMIGISQNIPYAGQKGLANKAARSQAEAASAGRQQTEVNLATAAMNAYLSVYYRQNILEYISAQREIQQDVVSSAIAKLQTNQAGQADVSGAQSRLWRLDIDILSTRQEIDAAFDRLYALMGQERPATLPTLIQPSFESVPSNLDQMLADARGNYSPLQKARRQAEGYDFSSRAAARMTWPMLGLSAGYGFREDAPPSPTTGMIMKRDDMISFQASISIPIFSGHQQKKMAASMNAMKLSSEAEANQIWRDTRAALQSIDSARQRLTESLKLYRERIIPADEDAYRSAFAGYESDRVPFSSLLDYAMNIYRDRLAANQVAFQLDQYMVQATQYIANSEEWK
jgi:cobalt-zinc-cadmium efflux system outer membrane protein